MVRLDQGKCQVESNRKPSRKSSRKAKQRSLEGTGKQATGRRAKHGSQGREGIQPRHHSSAGQQQINKTFTWNHCRHRPHNENTRMEMQMQQSRRHQTKARLTRLWQTGHRSRCHTAARPGPWPCLDSLPDAAIPACRASQAANGARLYPTLHAYSKLHDGHMRI